MVLKKGKGKRTEGRQPVKFKMPKIDRMAAFDILMHSMESGLLEEYWRRQKKGSEKGWCKVSNAPQNKEDGYIQLDFAGYKKVSENSGFLRELLTLLMVIYFFILFIANDHEPGSSIYQRTAGYQRTRRRPRTVREASR